MLVMSVALTAVTLGFAIASIAILHERDWRKRLQDSIVVDGLVVAERSEPDWEYTRAEIEYKIGNHVHRFVSKYGSGMLAAGHRVRVVVDTKTGDAERLAFATRWAFTIGPMLLGGSFVFFGLAIVRQYGG